MKQVEKILLAIDFTKASDSALQMAIAIAKTFNSEIILTHVIQGGFVFKRTSAMLKQAAENNLKKTQNEITKNKVKVSDILLATGSPFDQIIKHAEFYNVNLVMMGSGDKEKGEHFKLGITTHKVMRKSSKPVWVVKRDAPSLIKKILCPVDFSSPSCRALENSIHVARSFDAELTILTVIQPVQSDYTGIAVMPYEEEETYIKYEESRFNKFLQDFDFYNVKWDKVIRKGKPYQEILKTISDKETDLLVMGTIGISAPASVLMGSVTEKVIREVPCSIITLKTEDAIRLRLESDLKNIEESFKEGKELMEQGFDEEALHQFQLCLNIDLDFEPAWEYLAIVYERLGKKEQSENSRMQAKRLRERYWQQKIEAEMFSSHTLFGKRTH